MRHAIRRSPGPRSRRGRPLAPLARAPQVHKDGSVGGDDYYSLWQARFDGRTEEDASAAKDSPREPSRARRRWALAAAAILVVLLTHDPARQSAVGQALAAGAAGVSHVIGAPGQARSTGAVFDIEGVPSDEEALRLTSQATIEAMGFLLGVLFLLVILFIGEGVVWHGLVVIFGVVLLVCAVIRPPPPVGMDTPTPETVAVTDER